MQIKRHLFSTKLAIILKIMDNSLGKRIEQIRKIERLDIEEYMQFLDVTKTSYYNWRDGKNYPNSEVLIKILTRFPQYKAEWLLLGEGEINNSNVVSEPITNYQQKTGLSKADLKGLFKKMIEEIDNL